MTPHIRLAALLLAAAASAPTLAEDTRQLVKMPEPAQQTMRQAMVDNVGALSSIIGLLADNKVKEAGVLAESSFGMSTMGRHMGMAGPGAGGGMGSGMGAGMGGGMGPGRYMPEGMRSVAISLHQNASNFAKVAEGGDRDKALAALQTVTSTCYACHASYRIR
jgi:hypothetical protein